MGARTDADPRLTPAVEMIRRTGADGFQLRYSDDETPTVWLAVATYSTDGPPIWETAAGHDPYEAVARLCEQIIDGSRCAHCSKPSGFVDDIDPTVADKLICWYQWDPELATFRRGCE